jgi:hypothetical protein
MTISRKRIYAAAAVLIALVVCCSASSLALLILRPAGDGGQAAMSAAAQVGSTSRLMTFLAWLSFGSGCTTCLIPLAVLLGVFVWMMRAFTTKEIER